MRNYVSLYKKFEDYRKYPHISKSSLSTYLKCSLQYQFRYIDKIEPEFISDSLCFGSAIHGIVAVFYNHYKEHGDKIPIDNMMEKFSDLWENETFKNIQYTNGNDRSSILDLGIKMLEVFYDSVNPSKILAVEYPFSVDIQEIGTNEILSTKLIGSFDLVEQDEKSNIIISELKTSARKWADGKADTNVTLDASVYSYAMRKRGKVKTEEIIIRYDVLTKTKVPAFESHITVRTEKDDKRIELILNQVLKAIDSKIFYPNAGWWCQGCEYEAHCKAFI